LGLWRDSPNYPGTSVFCIYELTEWGSPHCVMNKVYLRGSTTKSASRSMKPIGLYCQVCKKIVTLEQYGKDYQDYLTESHKRGQERTAERIARYNSPEYQAQIAAKEAATKAKWKASYTATIEERRRMKEISQKNEG
jgi:hypothetical protein